MNDERIICDLRRELNNKNRLINVLVARVKEYEVALGVYPKWCRLDHNSESPRLDMV